MLDAAMNDVKEIKSGPNLKNQLCASSAVSASRR